MLRRVILPLALVAGVAVLAFFLLRDGPHGDATPGLSKDSGVADAGARDALTTETPGAGRRDEPRHAPRLFGRPRAERVGLGGLRGKVLLAADHTPVAGAKLTLEGTGNGGEAVVRHEVSGEDGTFTITDVPAGDDYVLAVAPAGLPGRVRGSLGVDDGALVDLGTLWIGEKAPLRGVVVDGRGVGIAGASVRVHEGHFTFGVFLQDPAKLFERLDQEPKPVAEARTAADGFFEVPALDPGPVTLVASAPGQVSAFLAAVVVADAGEQAPWTLKLSPGARVVGTVVDPDGRGIAGARVAVISGNSPEAFLYGRTFSTTGRDGAFEIDNAPAGVDLQVLVSAAGYPLTMARAGAGDAATRIVLVPQATVDVEVLTAPDDRPVAGASLFVVVQRGDVARFGSGVTDADGRVRLELCEGKIQMVMISHPEQATGMWSAGMPADVPGGLEGPEDGEIRAGHSRLHFRMKASVVVTGRVLDEAGQPIVGAELRPFGGMTFGRAAISDAEGRYRLLAGKGFGLVLMAAAPGYVPASVRVEQDDAASLERDVTMVRAATVTGRVTDGKGRPISGAQVRAEGASPYSQLGAPGARPAITGASGLFVLDSVPPGKGTRIVVRRPGFVDGASSPIEVAAGGATRLPDIVLGEGHDVVVRVLDPSGTPLADARVDVTFQPENAVSWDEGVPNYRGDGSSTTGPDGRATFDHVPTGVVTLTASHDAWAASSKTARVEEDAASPARVEIQLRAGFTLQGRVLDPDGKPVGGAMVMAPGDASGGAWIHDTSGEDGSFRLKGLPEGTKLIQVQAEGFLRKDVAFESPEELLEIRLVRESADRAAKREAVMARLMALQQQLQAAKSDAERSAIQEQMAQASQEWQALQEGED